MHYFTTSRVRGYLQGQHPCGGFSDRLGYPAIHHQADVHLQPGGHCML